MSVSAINFINSWTCHMAGSARRIVSQNKRTTARNNATNCQLRWPYRTSQWQGKTKQKQQGCGKVSTQVASGHQWLHLASLCSPLDGAVITAHCAQNITCLFFVVLALICCFLQQQSWIPGCQMYPLVHAAWNSCAEGMWATSFGPSWAHTRKHGANFVMRAELDFPLCNLVLFY